MAQNEAVLSATVRDYFVKNGGKVKRHDLFDHFRSQLDETSDQGKLKNQFGDIVNSLAVLQSIEGEKYFVLKKTRNGSTPVQFRRAPRGVNQRKDKGVSLPVSMRNFRFSSTDDPPGNLAESRARASSSRAKPPAKSDSLPNNLKRNNSDTSIIVENTGPEDDSGVDTLSSMHSESSSLGSRTDSLTKNTEPDELSQNSGDTGIFGDDDQYDLPSHVLSGLQKSWMMSSMVANKAHLVCLLEESPDVVLFKDFVMGYTALHWAAKQGNEEILRILIQGGADVNAKSNGGYTALHLASMHGKLNIINILIDECSVDVHVRDHSGKEPKDVGKKDMAEEIKQKLKDPVPAIDQNQRDSTRFFEPNESPRLKPKLRAGASFRFLKKQKKIKRGDRPTIEHWDSTRQERLQSTLDNEEKELYHMQRANSGSLFPTSFYFGKRRSSAPKAEGKTPVKGQENQKEIKEGKVVREEVSEVASELDQQVLKPGSYPEFRDVTNTIESTPEKRQPKPAARRLSRSSSTSVTYVEPKENVLDTVLKSCELHEIESKRKQRRSHSEEDISSVTSSFRRELANKLTDQPQGTNKNTSVNETVFADELITRMSTTKEPLQRDLTGSGTTDKTWGDDGPVFGDELATRLTIGEPPPTWHGVKPDSYTHTNSSGNQWNSSVALLGDELALAFDKKQPRVSEASIQDNVSGVELSDNVAYPIYNDEPRLGKDKQTKQAAGSGKVRSNESDPFSGRELATFMTVPQRRESGSNATILRKNLENKSVLESNIDSTATSMTDQVPQDYRMVFADEYSATPSGELATFMTLPQKPTEKKMESNITNSVRRDDMDHKDELVNRSVVESKMTSNMIDPPPQDHQVVFANQYSPVPDGELATFMTIPEKLTTDSGGVLMQRPNDHRPDIADQIFTSDIPEQVPKQQFQQVQPIVTYADEYSTMLTFPNQQQNVLSNDKDLPKVNNSYYSGVSSEVQGKELSENRQNISGYDAAVEHCVPVRPPRKKDKKKKESGKFDVDNNNKITEDNLFPKFRNSYEVPLLPDSSGGENRRASMPVFKDLDRNPSEGNARPSGDFSEIDYDFRRRSDGYLKRNEVSLGDPRRRTADNLPLRTQRPTLPEQSRDRDYYGDLRTERVSQPDSGGTGEQRELPPYRPPLDSPSRKRPNYPPPSIPNSPPYDRLPPNRTPEEPMPAMSPPPYDYPHNTSPKRISQPGSPTKSPSSQNYPHSNVAVNGVSPGGPKAPVERRTSFPEHLTNSPSFQTYARSGEQHTSLPKYPLPALPRDSHSAPNSPSRSSVRESAERRTSDVSSPNKPSAQYPYYFPNQSSPDRGAAELRERRMSMPDYESVARGDGFEDADMTFIPARELPPDSGYTRNSATIEARPLSANYSYETRIIDNPLGKRQRHSMGEIERYAEPLNSALYVNQEDFTRHNGQENSGNDITRSNDDDGGYDQVLSAMVVPPDEYQPPLIAASIENSTAGDYIVAKQVEHVDDKEYEINMAFQGADKVDRWLQSNPETDAENKLMYRVTSMI